MPSFSVVGSALYPIPAVSGRLYSLSMSLNFLQVLVQFVHILHWIMFSGGCVVHGTHSLIGFSDLLRQLWNKATGRNNRQLFPCCADAHWDWVQVGWEYVGFPWFRCSVCHRVQFYLILCLLFLAKKKCWGEQQPEAFAPDTHTLVTECYNFHCCYLQLKAVLRVSHRILCTFYGLTVI
jgi:hypothetical protein